MSLSRGDEAFWDKEAREARCLVCGSGAELAIGLAGEGGASALAEGRRRSERREQQTRDAYGNLIGGLVLRFTDDPQSTRSWLKGGDGERRLAGFLERELGDEAVVLNDRRIRGSRANIDHVVVGRSGVWVVDAKAYEGRVRVGTRGPIWRLEARLQVGGRDQTKLLDGVTRQVDAVRAALGPDPLADDAEVRGVLCFVESEWGFFPKPIEMRGVPVVWPGRLRDLVASPGGLTREAMVRLANRIAVALPPA